MLGIGMVVSSVNLPQQQPANLVKNPSMDSIVTDGFAVGWQGDLSALARQAVITDCAQSHGGKCSIRLAMTPGAFNSCAANDIPVRPNTTYLITWWCKTDGVRSGRAYLWLRTNAGQRDVLSDASQSGTQKWTQHFGRYTTTQDETLLRPMLSAYSVSDAEGYAWFDDVAVYEATFPPDVAAQYKASSGGRQAAWSAAIVLSRSSDLTVWSDNLAARIYREDGLPAWARPAAQVQITAARHEENYFQVVLLPRKDLHKVLLQPGDLKGPSTIGAQHVRVWSVAYTNVRSTHRDTIGLGLTPDPLVPATPTDALANQNRVFLIGLSVPQTAPPGLYKGAVAVTAEDKTIATVPVALRVYNFTLPAQPTFRTLVGYSAESFSRWDKRAPLDIEKDIARVLHDHGIRGSGSVAVVGAKIVSGRVVCDFTKFDERMQWLIDNLAFNAFFVGPLFGGGAGAGWQNRKPWLGMDALSPEFNAAFPQYMHQVGEHLRSKGWLGMTYVYLWDEPERDYFDKVVALQKEALAGDPGLKIWETVSPTNSAFWDVVKAWSIAFDPAHFDEAAVAKRRNAGDEIWVYNIPATLEATPQIHRLWFWQAARYGVYGGQLWQASFYRNIDPWEDITPRSYPTGREGEGLYAYDAGEGILLYPNKAGGPPFASLRLKLVQKGIDDFEYLAILERSLLTEAKRMKVPDPDAHARAEMREIAASVVPILGKYDMSVTGLEAAREEVARRIESIESGSH
jgi:hypothetical protein